MPVTVSLPPIIIFSNRDKHISRVSFGSLQYFFNLRINSSTSVFTCATSSKPCVRATIFSLSSVCSAVYFSMSLTHMFSGILPLTFSSKAVSTSLSSSLVRFSAFFSSFLTSAWFLSAREACRSKYLRLNSASCSRIFSAFSATSCVSQRQREKSLHLSHRKPLRTQKQPSKEIPYLAVSSLYWCFQRRFYDR